MRTAWTSCPSPATAAETIFMGLAVGHGRREVELPLQRAIDVQATQAAVPANGVDARRSPGGLAARAAVQPIDCGH